MVSNIVKIKFTAKEQKLIREHLKNIATYINSTITSNFLPDEQLICICDDYSIYVTRNKVSDVSNILFFIAKANGSIEFTNLWIPEKIDYTIAFELINHWYTIKVGLLENVKQLNEYHDKIKNFTV